MAVLVVAVQMLEMVVLVEVQEVKQYLFLLEQEHQGKAAMEAQAHLPMQEAAVVALAL